LKGLCCNTAATGFDTTCCLRVIRAPDVWRKLRPRVKGLELNETTNLSSKLASMPSCPRARQPEATLAGATLSWRPGSLRVRAWGTDTHWQRGRPPAGATGPGQAGQWRAPGTGAVAFGHRQAATPGPARATGLRLILARWVQLKLQDRRPSPRRQARLGLVSVQRCASGRLG
jgi:hypothetical protein